MKPNHNKYQDNTGKIKLKVHQPQTPIINYQLAKGACTTIEVLIYVKRKQILNSER